MKENVAHDCSGSSCPTSPISLALHGHAQIVEDPAPVSDANSDTRLLPSKRRLSDMTKAEPPRKRCRSGSPTGEDNQYTLPSSFSAAPLHERLYFLAWLFKTGLSESLSAASVGLPFAQIKTADQCTDSTRSRRSRTPTSP